jgi:hypothetical protein
MCHAPPVAIYYQTESGFHSCHSRAARGCFLEQVRAGNSSTLSSAKKINNQKLKSEKKE